MRAEGDFRDTLYTIDKGGNRKWVYAHFLSGRYFRARTIVAYCLLLFYLVMPWVTIGGKQGILLDFANRRFTFLGLELWATDTIFLFLVLGILAFSLFFFTSLFGRVWCGWACPETVFLEFLFRPIERLIEGSESQRRKLDAAAWSTQKILKKLLKHGFCAAAAWILASTALAYFVGREPLITMMSHSPLENPVAFTATLGLMLLMAFQFGWFREQFCTLLCPYARFQSVLMDQQSLLVGYDATRGEPRGKLRGGTSSIKQGDCVDCGLCVKVCPTGIDIRNGTQLECVACTACVDACDSVMDKIEKPRGLIRYTSEAALLGHSARLLRPRVVLYGFLLCVLISVLIFKLYTHQPVDIEIVRSNVENAFSVDSHQIVTNQFSLHIANKGTDTERFTIEALEPKELSIVSPLAQMSFSHGQVEKVPVFILLPLSHFQHGKAHAVIQVKSSGGALIERELTLLGPEQ